MKNIRYEMIHETRIIPLDNTPRTGRRSHMGDARGHREGHTLVVETTNFDPRTAYRNGTPPTKEAAEARQKQEVRLLSYRA